MTYNHDDEFFQNLEKYQEKLTQKFHNFRRSSKSDITSNTNGIFTLNVLEKN